MARTAAPRNEHLPSARDPWFRLHRQARLRRERFGGIVFHQASGRLIEVDHEAFVLLTLLRDGVWSVRSLANTVRSLFGRRIPAPEVAGIVKAFVERGMVEEVARPAGDHAASMLAPDVVPPNGDRPGRGSQLSSPITIHWAITYRCDLSCRHCYALPLVAPVELPREEKLAVVERLAKWGVLEVAFGGGEPTACPDLDDVLRAVRGAGMVPHVTTNGKDVTPARARTLAGTCGTVQLSLDRPEIIDAYRGRGIAARALRAAALLQDAGVQVGANLLLVPENIRSVERSLEFLESEGIHRVVLLRPFGSCDGRWPRGWPTAADWTALGLSLKEWAAREPGVSLDVACGLSFLLDDLSCEDRRRRLAFGCSGGRHFAMLRADGTVWPCSHLSEPGYRLGHILQDDLGALWCQAQKRTGAMGSRCIGSNGRQ